jgi:Holliday junction resolvase RusA-like endonuclease
MDDIRIEIPLRLPGLNEYTRANRTSKYEGAKIKAHYERVIGFYLRKARCPQLRPPVTIDFLWIEENRRRDLDNIAFAKKFILDALVSCGYLEDDNRKVVTAFRDSFAYAKESAVILTIHQEQRDE